MPGYTKEVECFFEAGRYRWRVLHSSSTRIWFEMSDGCMYTGGGANLVDDRWVLDTRTRNHLDAVLVPGTSDHVEAFFNEHGLPSDPEFVFADLEEVLLYADCVRSGRVRPADQLPESVRKILSELKEDEC